MTVSISSTGAAGAVNTADSNKQVSKTQVDYQSFLKLLVAQMKNQDPTQPMDSTQYVAQLATFSQVEQSVQMNSKLDQMLQSSALAQADAIIGRTIKSADGTISGTVAEVRLTSNGITAVLENGTTLPVGPGISISGA